MSKEIQPYLGAYVGAYAGIYVDARFIALGTDGFGRSDTRAVLWQFFEVDRFHIVMAAIQSLVKQGSVKASVLADAIQRYGINTDAPASWLV